MFNLGIFVSLGTKSGT